MMFSSKVGYRVRSSTLASSMAQVAARGGGFLGSIGMKGWCKRTLGLGAIYLTITGNKRVFKRVKKPGIDRKIKRSRDQEIWGGQGSCPSHEDRRRKEGMKR